MHRQKSLLSILTPVRCASTCLGTIAQKESRSCLEPLAAQIWCCRRQTVISSSTSEDKHLASQTASACLKERKRVAHWHDVDAFRHRTHTHTHRYTNDTHTRAGTRLWKLKLCDHVFSKRSYRHVWCFLDQLHCTKVVINEGLNEPAPAHCHSVCVCVCVCHQRLHDVNGG